MCVCVCIYSLVAWLLFLYLAQDGSVAFFLKSHHTKCTVLKQQLIYFKHPGVLRSPETPTASNRPI